MCGLCEEPGEHHTGRVRTGILSPGDADAESALPPRSVVGYPGLVHLELAVGGAGKACAKFLEVIPKSIGPERARSVEVDLPAARGEYAREIIKYAARLDDRPRCGEHRNRQQERGTEDRGMCEFRRACSRSGS